MRVRCIQTELDGWTADLSVGAEYAVLGIEADEYRIVGDRGEPALYAPSLFEVDDPTRPAEWISTIDDGVEYAYPHEIGSPGFFEDWHDREPNARRIFAQYLNRLLGRVA